jgi:hypothetical protein
VRGPIGKPKRPLRSKEGPCEAQRPSGTRGTSSWFREAPFLKGNVPVRSRTVTLRRTTAPQRLRSGLFESSPRRFERGRALPEGRTPFLETKRPTVEENVTLSNGRATLTIHGVTFSGKKGAPRSQKVLPRVTEGDHGSKRASGEEEGRRPIPMGRFSRRKSKEVFQKSVHESHSASSKRKGTFINKDTSHSTNTAIHQENARFHKKEGNPR